MTYGHALGGHDTSSVEDAASSPGNSITTYRISTGQVGSYVTPTAVQSPVPQVLGRYTVSVLGTRHPAKVLPQRYSGPVLSGPSD